MELRKKEYMPRLIDKKIEEYLYTEYGIDINVNYNERQSLKNVDIILNFNFI